MELDSEKLTSNNFVFFSYDPLNNVAGWSSKTFETTVNLTPGIKYRFGVLLS